jgi:hypothetical protein
MSKVKMSNEKNAANVELIWHALTSPLQGLVVISHVIS